MARTVGPILTIGAITMANQSLLNDEPIQWRVVAATGIAAGMFALAEKAWEGGATMLAYLALVSVLFVRLDPKVPSPVESFLKWWEAGGR